MMTKCKDLRFTATEKRYARIEAYLEQNPGATHREMIAFVPETKRMIEMYSQSHHKQSR